MFIREWKCVGMDVFQDKQAGLDGNLMENMYEFMGSGCLWPDGEGV